MYKNGLTDLLKIIIKACYLLLAVSVVFIYIITFCDVKFLGDTIRLVHDIDSRLLAFPFFAVVPAGYVAFACIDKLLSNVKKEMVFEEETLKLLNIISIACVYACAVGIVSLVISIIVKPYSYIIIYTVLPFGELFMALILQVVRQVFKKANQIKAENDLTV